MKKLLITALLGCACLPTMAKLPAPSDEAKAKAAEAAAKTAHGNKVAGYQLCQSMDKVAIAYFLQSKKDGKAVKPADKTDACADPGAFVYAPPPASPSLTAAPTTVAGAAAAAPAAPAAPSVPAAAPAPAAPAMTTAPAAAPKK